MYSGFFFERSALILVMFNYSYAVNSISLVASVGTPVMLWAVEAAGCDADEASAVID